MKSDDESDPDYKINEVIQSVDTPRTMSRQTSAEEVQGPLLDLDDTLIFPGRLLGPRCRLFSGYRTWWPSIN